MAERGGPLFAIADAIELTGTGTIEHHQPLDGLGTTFA